MNATGCTGRRSPCPFGGDPGDAPTVEPFEFVSFIMIAGPTSPRLLAVGDIDGDDDIDIVAGTGDGAITTLRAQ